MKRIIIAIVLFSAISFDASSQFLKISKDTLDTALFRILYKASQQTLKEGTTFIVTDTMALDVGQNWSVYYDWHKHRRDSTAKAEFKRNPPKRFSLRRDEQALQARLEARNQVIGVLDESEGESMDIFKHRKKEMFFIFDKGPLLGADTFTYFQLQERIPSHNWIITEDTLSVLGYNCQKATAFFRGRKYNAWFTMDIPIDDGPWKLYGLPGLILKANDDEGIFNFEAIGLQKLQNDTPIYFPTDQKTVACNSFQDLNAFRKNRFKKISIGFSDGNGEVTYFKTDNPVTYVEMEKETE